MTTRRFWFGLALAVLIAMVPGSAWAGPISVCDDLAGNLILNCGFEALPIVGSGAVPTDWSGSDFLSYEDVVTSHVNSGTYAMQIGNFDFQGAAILSQSFTDIAGATYQFTFYLFNGAGGNTSGQQSQAFWDSTLGTPVFTDTGGGAPAAGYTEETFSLTGTGSDSITFTAYNNPSEYYLDDVSVVETEGPSSTPEPASAVLLALGVAGLGLAARRRKA